MFRAGRILGLPQTEACWLDRSEIFRAISFHDAESMAKSRADYEWRRAHQ